MTVRIAVIGAGIMGADHARILAQDVPGARLQLICDASEQRARAVADATGAQDVTRDPEEAVARRDIDAVLIASPDETHRPLCLSAIQQGKYVLCEKPLAPTAAECREVVEAEISGGSHLLQVGFMRRFDPYYAQMKATLDDGFLGEVVTMHNLHHAVTAPPSFTGQMAVTNAAPHEFDIARHIINTDFCAVTAFQTEHADARGRAAIIVLQSNKGALVTIEVNVNAGYGYRIATQLVGSKASVELGEPNAIRLHSDLRAASDYPADWRPRFADAYRRQAKDWLRSIQSGKPSQTAATTWDGYRAAVIAEAAVQSLLQESSIAIPEATRPGSYDPAT